MRKILVIVLFVVAVVVGIYFAFMRSNVKNLMPQPTAEDVNEAPLYAAPDTALVDSL